MQILQGHPSEHTKTSWEENNFLKTQIEEGTL